ncbi:MAG: hypothetical protein AB2L07_21970 [Thermoanaerobaculaceae bacterium]
MQPAQPQSAPQLTAGVIPPRNLLGAVAGIVVALFCFASGVPLLAADEKQGDICLSALPKNASEIDHDYPGGKAPREFQYEFSVQIDQGERVAVPIDEPVLIQELATEKRHLVRIWDTNELIASFRFTFAETGGNHLCLYYTPWYQTWKLEPVRKGLRWCRCKSST